MKNTYAKALPEYRAASSFEKKQLLDAARRLKKKRKQPTSVALEEETIKELKALAEWRGVPYQILMRMFILDGLHRSKVADGR